MINAYLRDDITLKTVSTQDEWNTNGYTSATIKVRVEYKTHMIQNAKGEDVESNMQIFMKTMTLDKHRNRIVVEGIEYAILKIQRLKSFRSGNSGGHIQIWLALSTT